jgi:hypothetical protein
VALAGTKRWLGIGQGSTRWVDSDTCRGRPELRLGALGDAAVAIWSENDAGERVAGVCSARRMIDLRLAGHVIVAVLMDEIDLTRAEAHRALAAAVDARPVQRPARERDQPSSPLRNPQRRRTDLHAIGDGSDGLAPDAFPGG